MRQGVGEDFQRIVLRLDVPGLHLKLGDLGVQLLVQPRIFQRDRGGVGQGLQHPHLLVGRRVRLGPVVADGADGAFPADRHHGQALDEGRPVRLGRHTRIVIDVGDGRRTRMVHHPAGDAGLQRETLTLPQGFDGVLVGVIALVAVAQHEGRAVGAGQFARRVAGDARHGCDIARLGQGLDDTDQVLHCPNIP